MPANDQMAAIATTRFGLGARPGEIQAARGDPRGFVAGQIRAQGADQPPGPAESAAQRLSTLYDYQRRRGAGEGKDKSQPDPLKAVAKTLTERKTSDFLARTRLGATTEAAFRERWLLFWANHFTVTGDKINTAQLVGAFENEALRPHVFGRFEDLLIASTTHPAMLFYLDQASSFGPNSNTAIIMSRRQKRLNGLNENLAREILELHSVGLEAGYTQADVTEFARALSGFSVGPPKSDRIGEFVFLGAGHEPGARTVMGHRYGGHDQGQAMAILRDLAAHPQTAKHLSHKLARHFVADDPPPALVARLERAWLDSDGRLDVVAQALVAAPEAWDPTAAKFKTPYEFTVSCWRAIGQAPTAIGPITTILTSLGQKAYSAPSPKGWEDDAQTWCTPDALIKRLRYSESFAAATDARLDPRQIADSALGARLTPAVAEAITRTKAPREALAVLFMSPEFLRR
jgi:uncharacterized protein (DUF1800 family)